MALRAGFGAAVSVVAALIGVAFGSRIGGLFLACPAILPATLTLIEKKDGKGNAESDEHGSIAGAIGLVAFAGAGAWSVRHTNVAVALLVAGAAWLLASMAAYNVYVSRHQRNKRARGRLQHAHRG
ncbi:MAG TPA: DUF3147 family protein [Acidimicrobiales bacterium]|nr:DUF3147 family protein [Acidimicrobiales bacterium]